MSHGLYDQDQKRTRQKTDRHIPSAFLKKKKAAEGKEPYRQKPGADSEQSVQDLTQSGPYTAAEP